MIQELRRHYHYRHVGVADDELLFGVDLSSFFAVRAQAETEIQQRHVLFDMHKWRADQEDLRHAIVRGQQSDEMLLAHEGKLSFPQCDLKQGESSIDDARVLARVDFNNIGELDPVSSSGEESESVAKSDEKEERVAAYLRHMDARPPFAAPTTRPPGRLYLAGAPRGSLYTDRSMPKHARDGYGLSFEMHGGLLY